MIQRTKQQASKHHRSDVSRVLYNQSESSVRGFSLLLIGILPNDISELETFSFQSFRDPQGQLDHFTSGQIDIVIVIRLHNFVGLPLQVVEKDLPDIHIRMIERRNLNAAEHFWVLFVGEHLECLEAKRKMSLKTIFLVISMRYGIVDKQEFQSSLEFLINFHLIVYLFITHRLFARLIEWNKNR